VTWVAGCSGWTPGDRDAARTRPGEAVSSLLATDLLADAFGRVHQTLPAVVDGLGTDDLVWRPDPGANSIGWLVWHLTRVQDDHVAGVADSDQIWTASGWNERFGLPYPTRTVGYGQSSGEVGNFVLDDPSLLTGYHAEVHEMTTGVIGSLSEEDYHRVVDPTFTPPVTAAVRLVSALNDITQHLGQAAYVRGLLQRRS